MSTELALRASDIPSPAVNGSVKIPLAEIDKLRADYVSAVKLAKQLEEQQAQIKIIYRTPHDATRMVERSVWEPEIRDRRGNKIQGGNKTWNEFESFTEFTEKVTYKNLDDLLPRLKREAELLVKVEVDDLRRQKDEAHRNSIAAELALQEYQDNYEDTVNKVTKEGAEYKKKLLKRFKESHDNYELMVKEYNSIGKQLTEAKKEVERYGEIARYYRRQMEDNSIKGIWKRLFN